MANAPYKQLIGISFKGKTRPAKVTGQEKIKNKIRTYEKHNISDKRAIFQQKPVNYYSIRLKENGLT